MPTFRDMLLGSSNNNKQNEDDKKNESNKWETSSNGTPGTITFRDMLLRGSGKKESRTDEFNQGVANYNYVMDAFGRWYDQSMSGMSDVGWGDAAEASAATNEEAASWMNRAGELRRWANDNKDTLGDQYQTVMDSLQQITNAAYWMDRGYKNTAEDFKRWDTQEEYDQYMADMEYDAEMANFNVPGAMSDMYTAWKGLEDARSAYNDLDEIKRYQMAGYGTVPEGERDALKAHHEQRLAEITEKYGVSSPYDMMDLIYRMEEEYGRMQSQIDEASAFQQGVNTEQPAQHTAQKTAAEYTADLDKLNASIEAMDNYIQVLNARYAELDAAIANYSSSSDPEDHRRLATAQSELSTLLDQLNGAQQDYDSMMSQKWQLEKNLQYDTLSENADFASNNGYSVEFADDFLYRYINNRDGITSFLQPGEKHDADAWFIGENADKYGKYNNMTPEEVKNYNYLRRTQGAAAAYEYLLYLEPQMDARFTENIVNDIAGMTKSGIGGAVVANALSVPLTLVGGIGYLDIAAQNLGRKVTGSYAPINYNSAAMLPTHMSRAVRQTTAGMITDQFGTIQLEHPILAPILNGRGLADVYQLGMSAADSRVAGLTGHPAVATLLLASSAATQGVLDALERGATDEQALTLGLWNGVFEAFFEFFEVKELLKGNPNWVKNVVNQIVIEGAGEGFTDVANNIADVLIMADESVIMRDAAEYMKNDPTLTESQAIWKAVGDAAIDAGWSMIGGGISGGFAAGVQSMVQSGIANQKAGNYVRQNQMEDPLMDLARNMVGMGGYTGKLDTYTQRASNRGSTQNLGKVYNEVNRVVDRQNMDQLAQALRGQGMSQREATNLASAIALDMNGIELTKAQERLLEQHQDDEKVMAAVVEVLGSKAYYDRNAGVMKLHVKEVTRAEQKAPGQEKPAEKVSVPEGKVETTHEVSEDGETHLISEPEKTVKIQGIESIEDGTMKLRLDDGTVVDAGEVSYATPDEAMVYSALADMGMNVNAANLLASAFKTADISGEAYTLGIRQAYQLGQNNDRLALAKGEYSSALTEHQRDVAFKMGKIFGGQKTAKAIRKARKNAPKNSTEKTGKVHFDRNGRTFDDVRETALKTMEQLSAALGIEFYVYESYVNKNGQRVYKDENGIEVKAPNGWYDPATGAIHIDLNAGNTGKGTMLFTIAHELTHFMKDKSPAKYKVLANFLVEQYNRRGQTMDELVQAQITKAKRNDRTMSPEVAFDEVVADSMEGILKSGNVIQVMADLKQQDKSLWQMIVDWFKDLAEDLKKLVNAYKDVKPDSVEGKMVEDMQDVIVILESLYTDALIDAGENHSILSKSIENSEEISYSSRYQKPFFKENVFPPYDESQSDSHEVSERWSRSPGIVSGDRRLISHHGRWYMIQAFDDLKYGYQIVKKLTKNQYIQEASYYETITEHESLQAESSKIVARYRGSNQDGRAGHRTDNDPAEYRGENRQIRRVDTDETGRRETKRDGKRGMSGSNLDTQGESGSSVKFSLREPVEYTRNLVALHNLTEDKLAKTLDLGGFPMPSIAITKADIPHTNFGDITLVFGRETIDPKANKKNVVYSADAWTPVFPRTEYEENQEAGNRVYKRLSGLERKISDTFKHDLRRVYTDIEGQLNRYDGEEGLIEYAIDNYGMKAAYLEEQGNHISEVTVQKEADLGYNPANAEMYQKIADVLGVTTAEEMGRYNLKKARDEHGDELEAIRPGITKSPMRLSGFLGIARNYMARKESGPVYETVTDYQATRNAVDDAIDQAAYEAWVRKLFEGIVKDTGIYNNKDLFTPSGNRRSFKQTHLPVTLENIVKAMASQNGGSTKNVSGFNGIKTLRAGTAERFKSVEAMHQREGRLQNLTPEQLEEVSDQLQSRLYDIIKSIDEENDRDGSDNSLIRYDTIGNIITEISESGKFNVADIQQVFRGYGKEVSDDTALALKQLLFDVSQMPVNLFEAKPERVVRFDEVKTAILPKGTDQKIVDGLEKNGVPVQFYEVGNNEQRLQMVNSMDGLKFSERDAGAERVADTLRKENVKLKEDVKHLKELLKLQRSVTNGTKVTRSSVEAAAGMLMKSVNARGDKAQLTELLTGFYEYIAAGEDLTWDNVMEKAEPVSDWLMRNQVEKHELDSFAQDVLRDIRGSRFYLDDQQKQNVAYKYGSYNEFRKKMMGTAVVTDKANMSLDSWWHDMAGQYPSIFDETISSSDMPEAFADAIDRLRSMEIDPYGYNFDREMMARDIMYQVYDSYWNVSTLKTVADVKQKQINELKGKHAARIEKIRAEHRKSREQLKEQFRSELAAVKKDMRKAERENIQKAVERQRQIAKDTADRKRDNAQKAEMRRKIRKTIRDLDKLFSRGDKKRNVKEGMRDLAATVLASAEVLFMDNYAENDMIRDGVTVTLSERESRLLNQAMDILAQLDNPPADPAGIEAWYEQEPVLKQKLARLRAQLKEVFERQRNEMDSMTVKSLLQQLANSYAELMQSEDSFIRDAFDENVYEHLLTIMDGLGYAKVKDMRLDQLEALYDAYNMVLTTVRNANKLFDESIKETKQELANKIMIEESMVAKRKPKTKAGATAAKFMWDNLKPVYAFERIGSSTLSRLYGNIRKGQDSWAIDMRDANEFRKGIQEKYNFDSWDMDKVYTFKTNSGADFKLTLEQLMSIYAYSKRAQAYDHMMKGGFVFDDSTTTVNKLGIHMLKEDASTYKVSLETMSKIVGALTQEQAKFVDEMQEYLSSTMGEKGNSVSMKLYGIKLFNEKNYFPLKSAGQYMAKAKEADLKKQQGQINLASSGFTMAVAPKASNPIVLSGFMDVWAGHVNEMSMYHSFVLPMEDFRRVYNYATPNEAESASASVNAAIQNAHGKAATAYIDQLYKDLNGGALTDSREGLAKSLVGKFKKAAVMASLSVVFQQPSAIGRAFSEIDYKHFKVPAITRGTARALFAKKKHDALWSELKKYAPVAMIKEMGYFDTGMGMSAKEYLQAKEYEGWAKAKGFFTDSNYRDEVLSKPAAVADEMTWIEIWKAVKNETAERNPDMDRNSEEFLKIAGTRFAEVIDKTQVYDSVLARSANMRSKSLYMNMATSFMSEPTTTMNMVWDALTKASKGQKKAAARAIASVAVSIIINAALSSIIYAARDDDEDETWWEKYFSRFLTEIVDSFNPITYIPLLKDIWSIFQGFDVERADMSLISDLADSLKSAISISAKDTSEMKEEQLKEWKRSLWAAWMDTAGVLANMFGVPARNIAREIDAIINVYDLAEYLRGGARTTLRSLGDVIGADMRSSIPVLGWLPGRTKADKLFDALQAGDQAYADRLIASYGTEKQAQTAIRGVIKERYLAGDIDKKTARDYLTKYGGKDINEAYFDLKEWDYEKVNDDEYKKYQEFYTAVQTGVNLKKVIKEYTDNGVDPETLRGQITDYFKPIYVKMSAADRASMKGYILNALELCGAKRWNAEDMLAEWDFEASHRQSYDDMLAAYRDGKMTADALMDILLERGMTEDEAADRIVELDILDKYGIEYSDRTIAYAKEAITEGDLRDIYEMKDYTEEEIDIFVDAHNWIKDNKRTDLPVSKVEAYVKPLKGLDYSIEDTDMDIDDFLEYKSYISDIESDKDEDGKAIAYSRINKAYPYIDRLPLTPKQKTALAVACGWDLKTVEKNKLW